MQKDETEGIKINQITMLLANIHYKLNGVKCRCFACF